MKQQAWPGVNACAPAGSPRWAASSVPGRSLQQPGGAGLGAGLGAGRPGDPASVPPCCATSLIALSVCLLQEEECRNSLDPKYSHLSDDLHVEISAMAPPAEAHARIAFALAEIRKYMVPDSNDEIRQASVGGTRESRHQRAGRQGSAEASLAGLPPTGTMPDDEFYLCLKK